MFTDDYGNRRFPGLYRGLVFDNRDPLEKGRLRLQVPQVLGDAVTDWAWGTFSAGVQPSTIDVGQGLWVEFEGGDPSYPIWTNKFDSSGSIDYLQLDTFRTEGSTKVGMLAWSTDDETPEIKVGNGDVVLQIGQESHVRVYNNTGTDILENHVVYLSGGESNAHPHVGLYRADGTISPFRVLGITAQTIPNGEDGLVTQLGKIRTINTSAYTAGDTLYASATEYGLYQTTLATAPDDIVAVGTVVVSDAVVGEILVNITPLINQLQTNLVFFSTTAASNVSGYNKLVNSTLSPDFNTVAVDVRIPSTGYLNSADEVLVGSLIADANEFVGNPGDVEIKTIGAIRKISGNNNTRALFYFRVYHRTSAGVETLLGQSNKVGPASAVTLNQYEQFESSANVTFTTFSNTDRMAIKYYADVDLNGNQAYSFRFGGISPVRTLLPVPVNVVATPAADDVTVTTTNFNKNLSSANITVQKALDTIDDLPVVKTTDAGTVTNTMLSNSSITVNGSPIALGASATVSAAPSGTAGGKLSGTYPNPGLNAALDDLSDSTISSASEGQTLRYNSSGVWVNSNIPSPNYLINGGFTIWQRGTSGFTTSGNYTADRWVAKWDAGTATVGQSTDVPTNQGMGYSISVASTSGTNPKIYQRIESAQSRQFAGKTITISVWAKSTVGTAGLVWGTSYPGTDDNWASETTDQSGTFTASMTVGTWTRYTSTFTANSLATRGYAIVINRNVTTTSTTTLWTGIQLEEGSIATPFRRSAPNIQSELSACQRYYTRFTGSAATDVTYFGHGFGYDGSNARFGVPLPTTMRVTPTAIEYNNLRAYNGTSAVSGTITLYTAGSRPTLLSVNLASGSVSTGSHYALEGVGSGSVPYLSASAEL